VGVRKYESLRDFYADDDRRRLSGEADYGVHWKLGNNAFPRWRVSYVHETGEVYAVALVPGSRDQVVVMGVVPPDEDGVTYYDTLDKILHGWEHECGKPGSLDWVMSRLSAVLPSA
jgi:hypothetical protein